MSKAKRKRSRLFVDARVQGALMRQLILHWLLACAIIFAYLLILEAFASGFGKPISEHLSALWERYGMLTVVLAAIFPVFAYDSVKLSNRFAGPMVSFRQALQKLAHNEQVQPLSFRRGDFWKEFAEDFNAVAEKMSELNERADNAENDSEPELVEAAD